MTYISSSEVIFQISTWARYGPIFALFLFNITNFHVITVRSVLDVWILSMDHYTCHDNSYIFYYESYGPPWIFCKHNVLMSSEISIWCRQMTIGRISLCDTSFESCWKGLQFVLRICWWFCIFEYVMDWKLKILLNFAFHVFLIWSILTTFPSLHERVTNGLHFIFWIQFWNINHECIMDTFCHFFSLTLTNLLWLLVHSVSR